LRASPTDHHTDGLCVIADAAAERDATIAERDGTVAAQATAISERDTQLADRATKIAALRAELASKNEQLADKVEVNSRAIDQIDKRDATIAERDATIAEHVATIAAHATATSDHAAAIAERDEKIAARDATIVKQQELATAAAVKHRAALKASKQETIDALANQYRAVAARGELEGEVVEQRSTIEAHGAEIEATAVAAAAAARDEVAPSLHATVGTRPACDVHQDKRRRRGRAVHAERSNEC
jgi:chromosome segregation ATPase